jgi:hypothetical protein
MKPYSVTYSYDARDDLGKVPEKTADCENYSEALVLFRTYANEARKDAFDGAYVKLEKNTEDQSWPLKVIINEAKEGQDPIWKMTLPRRPKE